MEEEDDGEGEGGGAGVTRSSRHWGVVDARGGLVDVGEGFGGSSGSGGVGSPLPPVSRPTLAQSTFSSFLPGHALRLGGANLPTRRFSVMSSLSSSGDGSSAEEFGDGVEGSA